MALVLASLALFGLGIFGPGIATGLVAGAPQLGAGAAIGTGAALVGGDYARGRRRAHGAGRRPWRDRAPAPSLGTGAATAYAWVKRPPASGRQLRAGLAGVARAGGGAAMRRADEFRFRASAASRTKAAWRATGGARRRNGAAAELRARLGAAPAPRTSHARPRPDDRTSHQGRRPAGGHGLHPTIREKE